MHLIPVSGITCGRNKIEVWLGSGLVADRLICMVAGSSTIFSSVSSFRYLVYNSCFGFARSGLVWSVLVLCSPHPKSSKIRPRRPQETLLGASGAVLGRERSPHGYKRIRYLLQYSAVLESPLRRDKVLWGRQNSAERLFYPLKSSTVFNNT